MQLDCSEHAMQKHGWHLAEWFLLCAQVCVFVRIFVVGLGHLFAIKIVPLLFEYMHT